MLLSSVPATMPQNAATKMKIATIVDPNPNPLDGGSSSPKSGENLLAYHGYLYGGYGWTTGFTWEVAMRLTPTEMSSYVGQYFTAVNWFNYHTEPLSGSIRIYNGTATGTTTLISQTPYTVTGIGWKRIVLGSPVKVPATGDIWVSVQLMQTHGYRYYPYDQGPAVVGKSDWYNTGSGWSEVRTGSASYNRSWMIEAIVSSAASDDVGVSAILSPVGGTAAGAQTPSVTVTNYGTNDATNIPVNVKIGAAGGSPNILYRDGFEAYNATDGNLQHYNFPPGWTRSTTNRLATWYVYTNSLANSYSQYTPWYTSTMYPRIFENNTAAQDESLISPAINLSGLSRVCLNFTKYFYCSGADSKVYVNYSTDGGVTWVQRYMWGGLTTTNSTAVALDMSAYPGVLGCTNFKVKFEWVSGADASLVDYFYFDNFYVYKPVAWGPYGNNPPAGWTITNASTGWTYNQWHRSPSTYTSYDFLNYYARLYYASPYQARNDSLISPVINCVGLTQVKLSFANYWYYDSAYLMRGYVEGSTDGGATWPYLVRSFMYPYEYVYYTYCFDISSWAAGQANVKIRFRFVEPATNYGSYWYIDNVCVGSNTETRLIETFDGPGYFTNFKDVSSYYGDGMHWMYANNKQNLGIWTSQAWQNSYYYSQNFATTWTTWATPVIAPHGGLRFGFYYYNSALVQKRLYAGPFDLATVQAPKLSIWMFHDVNGPTYNDSIQVQASFDGKAWFDCGAPILRSTTLGGWPAGWVNHSVDLTGFGGSNTVYVAFVGTPQTSYSMAIDDMTIYNPGFAIRYERNATVNLTAGQSQTLTFDSWTPLGWHNATQQNTTVSYTIIGRTNMVGDQKPSNDAFTKSISLYYPFINDVKVDSILQPVSGTAQTLPVSLVVKNIGQDPEYPFFVKAEIGTTTHIINGYSSSFDIDNGSFVVRNGTQWEWGVPTSGPMAAHSGTKLWATKLAGNYENQRAALMSPQVTVPATNSMLTYWHWYDFENSYDGYNVKISTNNGTTWTLMTPVSPAYSGVTNTANPLGNGVAGIPIYTNHGFNYWAMVTFNLAAYANQTVRICFDFGADTSVFYPGAYIDDVLIGSDTVVLTMEYTQYAAVTTVLNPGESRTLTFLNWTPANIAAGVPGTIEYAVKGTTLLPTDGNTANDMKQKIFALDYWHDVSVTAITSPSLVKVLSLKAPSLKAVLYKAPGVQQIKGTVKNTGTFNEIGLVAHAVITNTTAEVYNNTVGSINLPALTGQQDLTFPDQNFVVEGLYTLTMSLPLSGDKYPTNNQQTLSIGIDATPPTTTAALNPVNPNGLANWYITNPTVTLTASDPILSGGGSTPGSGVASIKYKIDSGVEMTYTGSPFPITGDGSHTVTYWSIDKVGNTETQKTTPPIKIDTTPPLVNITKEKHLNSMIFTANATDATSGMNRVEFYVEDALQFVDTEAPYQWTMSPVPPGTNLTVKAIAYDNAGLFASITTGSVVSQPTWQTQPAQQQTQGTATQQQVSRTN